MRRCSATAVCAHLEALPLPGGAAAIERPWRTAAGWAYALLGQEGLERAARLLRERVSRANLADRRRAGGLQARSTRPQRAAHDELRPPLRRRRRPRGRPRRGHLRGPGGDRARDDVAAQRPVRGAVPVRGGRRRRGRGHRAAAGSRRVGRRPREPPRRDPLAGGRPLGAAPRRRADDLEAGATPGAVGARLHATVAAVVLELCRRVSAATGLAAVALSRRRLPEPAADRPLRERPGGGASSSCPPAWCRQRRRCLGGAGRRGGLYCPAETRPAGRAARRQGLDHVPCPPHAHHRRRRSYRDHRRRGSRTACQPDAGPRGEVGDYVLVHAGFAISVLDEAEAEETLALLAELAACGEAPLADAGDA